ncbi:MAG TPA: DUF2254 family protein [Thermoleophilia bacterium]|nr:DUF2254 family protein [Thermoleophilia bacterium]
MRTPLLNARLRWILQSPYFYPSLAVPVGVLLAVSLRAVDVLAPAGSLPTLEFPAANVRTLFAGVAGAMITATAVLFWVRSALVQLAASQLSPRVLSLYMHDRFQQASTGFLLGVFTYLVIVLLELPAEPDAVAPLLSTLLGAVLAIVALLSIIVAITTGVYATRLSHVLARLADETVAQVEEEFPEREAEQRTSEDIPPAPAEAVPVFSRSHGWLQRAESQDLLNALPQGAEFWLEARVGLYLTEGAVVGRLLLPAGAASGESARRGVEDVGRQGSPGGSWPDPLSRLQDALRIETTRSLRRDLTFGIRELVDIGLSALAPGTKDTTAAFEVILQLGTVLRQIMLRKLPPVVILGEEGRAIYRMAELGYGEYVDLCFQQIRLYGSQYPSIANVLLNTFGMLQDQLRSTGVPEHAAPLRRQAALVLEGVKQAPLLEADRERVYRVARWYGFDASDADPRAQTEVDLPQSAEGVAALAMGPGAT